MVPDTNGYEILIAKPVTLRTFAAIGVISGLSAPDFAGVRSSPDWTRHALDPPRIRVASPSIKQLGH